MPSKEPLYKFPEEELVFTFVTAGGPGGQNVNKVATACQLRFDVANSPSLTAEVKTRLIKLAGKCMTAEGVLVIEAKRYRTQENNRADALERLNALHQKAAQIPEKRVPTRPSASVRAARVAEKKKRGQTKQSRRIHPTELE